MGSLIVLLLGVIIIPNINWDGVFRNHEIIEDPKTGWTIEDKNVFCDKIKEISPTAICDCALEKIMPLFTFDANQLSAAKLLFDRLLDKDKASSLTKHITFDSTKMEFRNYISGKN